MKYLTISSPKTRKGESLGILTGILYLAPSTLSGVGNVCPFASPGCKAACLNTAGRGRFTSIQAARITKTRAYFANKTLFIAQIADDISALVRKAHRMALIPAVRLNGTSDIPWEKSGLMEQFPLVRFYDYTKNPKRFADYLAGKMPSNYSLTFSRSEVNGEHVSRFLREGGNVAVVFSGDLPPMWEGFPVVVGDDSDARFLDPVGNGNVIGLTAKGRARGVPVGGFVVASN